jgi:hypothetical protein
MTATIHPTIPTTTTTDRTENSTSTTPVWRAGLAAGVTAAVATTAIAAVASAAGVSFETAPGDAIPVLGFGQLTLFFTAIGVLIARVIGRRSSHPRSTFVKTTLVLTALSVVPDLTMAFDVASKATLMLTHITAAVIVIPVLASRLAEQGRR